MERIISNSAYWCQQSASQRCISCVSITVNDSEFNEAFITEKGAHRIVLPKSDFEELLEARRCEIPGDKQLAIRQLVWAPWPRHQSAHSAVWRNRMPI